MSNLEKLRGTSNRAWYGERLGVRMRATINAGLVILLRSDHGNGMI